MPPNKRDVGFLFQNYALWPHMTVRQNIAFGLENLKWEKPRIAARVEELTKMLKIQEYLERYPSELSGGQQQRVAIARYPGPGPKVLFMDEPLSTWTPSCARKCAPSSSASTWIPIPPSSTSPTTSWNHGPVLKVCLMEKGVLQQYARPLTMYLEPENLFVADFMGSPTMNFIPGRVAVEEKSCPPYAGRPALLQAGRRCPACPKR